MAEYLNLENYDEKNLRSCCPYHTEDTPSFIYNPKKYNFHCFGCNRNVDIMDVFIQSGMTFIDSAKKLFELADVLYVFSEANIKTKRDYIYPHEEPNTDKTKVYEYLEKRKISRESADYADIRQDANGNIVFNYYDTNDVLTMVKYRPSRKVKKGEPKCWCQQGADTTSLLFNMNRINTNNPIFVSEGELDSLSAIEAGYKNAVSVPLGAGNLHWINENWDWLEQFSEIILCADNDKAGEKFIKEAVPRLGSWRTKVVEIPQTYIINDKVVKVKDLNEVLFHCGKEEVLRLILNAKDTPIPSVKDLSDITDIDLDEIDGIYTGLEAVDKQLMKLFYGTLTVLSGIPGSGKSSLLTQIMCNTLDQDKSCWLYSGELPEYMTKNWFNYIFAGARNIDTFPLANGDKYYKVRDSAKSAINEYYRGKWFVYKDDQASDLASLTKSMEDVVRKEGVKLLVLDNMMTIDFDDDSEEFNEQARVMNTMRDFAKKYHVAIILVCHPRKLAGTTSVGMYDAAGTSKIPNLCHRFIGMRRTTDEEKSKAKEYVGRRKYPADSSVVINIIKDRMRGRSNIELGLYYDPASRRFYSTKEEYNHKYLWDSNDYGELLLPPNEEKYSEVFGEIKTGGTC